LTESATDLADLLEWLDGHWNMEALSGGVPQGGSRRTPSLARMQALLHASGDPQDAYPVLHITGTNGKTSTARILASILASAGLAVGTTTSPNLERLNERMTGPPVTNQRREKTRRRHDPISDHDLADQLRTLRGLEPLLAERPSFFDIVVASAFRWFADIAVDAAVVEVGLGGRWDSTNLANGQVAVITNVGLDHTEYLGPTRADIAREKAGIIKPGAVVVLGETDRELVEIFEQVAGEVGAEEVLLLGRDFEILANETTSEGRSLDIRTPYAEHTDLVLPLHGRHQGHNAALAVVAAEAFFGGALGPEVVADGVAHASSPGRLETVGHAPLIILDGAHNAHAMAALGRALDEELARLGPAVLVFGTLNNHDPTELLEALGPQHVRLVVACPAPSPRAVPPDEIAAAARLLGIEAVSTPSVEEALEAAVADAKDDELVLVTGSLYVVGAARRLGHEE
jgi:dihydrofolate synthase/folylpolyglutamate synthase